MLKSVANLIGPAWSLSQLISFGRIWEWLLRS